MRDPAIVMLTADQLRHRYAAASLARDLPLSGVVFEAKPAGVTAPPAQGAEDAEVIAQHFRERDAVEQALLGAAPALPEHAVLKLPAGQVNHPEAAEWIAGRKPDLVLLYGTGMIQEPLLGLFQGRMINLHLGLSPYYRGAGTNFWPLVLREPECVGATIHLATGRVDAGAILAQIRPDWENGDGAHEAGTRTLQAAIRLLPAVVGAYWRGRLKPVEQDLSGGRVFRVRDFNAEAVRKMRRNLADGMIPDYLGDRDARDRRVPILEFRMSRGGAA